MTTNLLVFISMATVLVGCNGVDKDAGQASAVATPGNVLALNARGCIATTEDGKRFALPASAAGSAVLIPKGTRFTAECFPTSALSK